MVIASSGPGAGSAVEQAGAWVTAYLVQHGGTARSAELLAAAAKAGHNARTCRRAGTAAGIVVTRVGFGKGSTWALPTIADDDRSGHGSGQESGNNVPSSADEPADESPLAMTTPPATHRVPTRTDIYGRPTEYVEVSDLAARGHWDQRQWERIGE